MPNQKVLIVEDDLAFVTLIQLALKDLDFEFEIARDGRIALERLQKIKYDLVISDFRLPHIHGLKLVQAAQKQKGNCQIILISASTPESIDFDIKKTPILGFMQKPFSPLELRDLVTKHFDSLAK